MAIQVKHKFVSAKVDTLDNSRVQPSNWNDTHDLLIGPAVVIGRGAGAGQAAAAEIPMGATGQALLATATAAAARAAIVADDSQTTIGAAAAKVTPVDADVAVILDSAAANVFKRVTWANIKATLLAYFQPTLQAAYDARYVQKTDPVIASVSRNIKATVISNSQVTVTADVITVEDATGKFARLTGVNVTANLAAAGANGLDAGGEVANAWYYVWLIYNGVTTALLLSASSTAPTMPGGYTHKRLIGAVRNDAGANLWRTIQNGNKVQVVSGVNPVTPPIICSGAQGNTATPTYVAQALGTFVPPIAEVIRGVASMVQQDGHKFMLAPNNSYGRWDSTTNAPPLAVGNNGITGSFIVTNTPFDMVLESTNLYYAANNGNSNVQLSGWELNL